ncbi:MAG: nitroreductase family deazaflavin-dependent oxidoreductase [Microthrixaceae bacterium]
MTVLEDDFAYLTTTGRRTGEPHEIEIWYALDGDTIWMMAGGGRGSDWVRNLEVHPGCRIRLGRDGPDRSVRARFPSGREESAARRALHDKYRPRVGRSLDSWRDTALVVALDPRTHMVGAMSDAAIDYVELPATGLGSTKAFYSQVFGWEWTDYGDAYAVARSGGLEVALSAAATPAPAHEAGSQSAIGPLVLFGTVDLEALESAVREAGGEVVTPPYPYPGGRRFHFADPSGNVLGAYQPAT